MWPSLGLAVAVVSLVAAGIGEGTRWGMTLVALTVVNAVFMFFFFRDPRRKPPDDEALVLAPGDGRIVEISEVSEPTFVGGQARRISIFLSIFDVHVQRAPMSGTVAHRSYKKGAFDAAWSSHASEANEQSSLGLENGSQRILVRQIAGLVARRIITDHDEGERVARGERIGLIRFGSRVDTFLPLDWPVECRIGERAVAGQSVLARRIEVGVSRGSPPAAAKAPGAPGDRSHTQGPP